MSLQLRQFVRLPARRRPPVRPERDEDRVVRPPKAPGEVGHDILEHQLVEPADEVEIEDFGEGR